MPTSYAYKVRDREGKMAAGAMEAESEQAVVTRLRQMGYAPISIEEEKGAGLKTEIRLPGVSGVKLKDLAVFSRQFATMINSGLSLLRALTILGEQISNRRLGDVIVQVRAEVEKGTSLSAAWPATPRSSTACTCPWSGPVRSAASSTRCWSRWPRPSRRRSSCGARSARP
jgi:type IV pilus assembly protein PilC